MLRPCCASTYSTRSLASSTRHLSQLAARTGLRSSPSNPHPPPPAELAKRAEAYVAAWRTLAWRDALRIPFPRPPADSAQAGEEALVAGAPHEIVKTHFGSRLRGTTRREIRRRLPWPVKTWALDASQDLLVALQDAPEPPYKCHLLSLATGDRHPLAERDSIFPPFADDAWAAGAHASARVHGSVVGIVSGGRLSVWDWRAAAAEPLLDIECADDFCFLDDEHVLTADFDWDTLCARIRVHAFPSEFPGPDPPPVLTFALPRLRTVPSASDVYVRLHSHTFSPPPPPPDPSNSDGFGTFEPDPSDAALFLTLQVVGKSASRPVRGLTFCAPLSLLSSHLSETLDLAPSAEFEIPWAEWGPYACGAVPDDASRGSRPVLGVACCGMRAVRSSAVVGENPGEDAVAFEVFDFHPGRVELARLARRANSSSGPGPGKGTFAVKEPASLDPRLWDAEDARAAPGLGYVVSRRKVPRSETAQGRALINEDGLLYVPVRDFVTGVPAEYQAFVF